MNTQIPTEDLDEIVTRFNNGESIEELKKKYDKLKDAHWGYLRSVDQGKAEVSQWTDALENASSGVKGLTKTLKLAAKNMGIMLAVSIAIQGAMWIFDQLNVTLEEQQEIVDNTTSEVKALQEEYDKLSKTGNLTEQEKDRLDMLERQLEVKKELLAIQTKELAEKDLYGTGEFLSDGNLAYIGENSLDNAQKSLDNNIASLKDIREQLEGIDDFSTFSATKLVEDEAAAVERLKNQKQTYLEAYQSYSDSYDLIKKYMDAGAWDDDPQRKQYHKNLMQTYLDAMNSMQDYVNQIDITLGVTVDTESAKAAIAAALKKNKNYDQDTEDWLNELDDEDINLLFRLQDVGEYSLDELQDYIKDARNEAEEPIEVEVTTTQYLSQLESLEDGFNALQTIYNDIRDKDTFDFGSLIDDTFVSTFGEYTEEYNKFIDVVTNSPSDIASCQSAFDDLVSAWFYGQEPLKNITDETYDLTVAWLQQQGVENAVEMADYALAESKKTAFIETHELKEGTWDEIQALMDEAEAAGFSEGAMYDLAIAIATADDSELSFEQQINAIYDIADAAGLAKTALDALVTSSPLPLTVDAARYGKNKEYQAEKRVNDLKDAWNKWRSENKTTYQPTASYRPKTTGGGGSGGSNGSDSAKEKYVAEVDAYKNLTDAVEEYDRKLTHLNRVYENTDDVDERIALKQEEIKLYKEQKDAVEALNQARDKEISSLVTKLRGQGFQIDYDPSTEYLLIKNREHINDLNQDIIEEYEDYIDKVDELNDANKDSADQWDELTYSIIEASEAIEELEQEKYEDYIETAEHILRLMENRKDAFGKESSVYLKMMNTTLDRWANLVKTDYTGNLDQIRECEEAWMDFYDERIEKEKEILGLQLDDNDAVLDGVIKVIEDQIAALDDQIDGLQKANDERKKALELQKAQAELDKQRNQKTRKVLRQGVGWVYEADEDAIREAEENLADLEYDAKIDALEDEKEALEDLKEKWEEIPDIVEDEQNRLLMIEKLGANAEEDILNGRVSTYEKFKDDYIDIQQQIQDKTDELEEHTSAAYLTVVKAFENMAKLTGITLDTNKTTGSTTQSSWYVNRDGTAPSKAKVGDIVYTKGGTYQITAKDENGKFTSKKIDSKSTNIRDDQWGELASVMSESNETFSKSIDEVVSQNKELAEQTKQQILETNGWSKIIADNTGMTQKEITALFENVDMSDILSEFTEENSDATNENTKALMSVISALASLELEIEEIPEDPFDDLDWDSLTEDEKAWANQMQKAYETAIKQGNTEFAQQILDMLQDLKDGNSDDYLQIGKDAFSAATSGFTFEGKTSTGGGGGSGTEDRVADLKWLQSKVDEDPDKWSDEFKDRLERAIAIEQYGSGTDSYRYNNGYLTTDIISATNEAENYMTADELKLKYDYEHGKTDNGYDPEKMAEKVADRIAEAIEDGVDSIWGGFLPSDFDYASEVLKDNADSLKDYDIPTTSSGNKTSGQKNTETYVKDKSDRDKIADAQKKYNEAKAKGDTQGMADAHAEAESVRNKYGYSGGSDGSEYIATSKNNTKTLNDNIKATGKAADTVADSADVVSDAGDKAASTIKDAADSMASAASKISSSSSSGRSSGGSSGSNGGSSSGSSGKVLAGSDTDSKGNKKTVSGVSSSGGYTVTRYTDGSAKVEKNSTKNKKAKGGINLSADTYNVDELGEELLVSPEQGRYVRIEKGGGVIPANVTKNLWEMGINPPEYIRQAMSGVLKNLQALRPSAAMTTTVCNEYNIGTISLPDVRDVNGFAKDLPNLPNLAKQYMTRKA